MSILSSKNSNNKEMSNKHLKMEMILFKWPILIQDSQKTNSKTKKITATLEIPKQPQPKKDLYL